METEDESTELQLLQKKVFGRDGGASAWDLQRLAELQNTGSTDDSAEETEPGGTLASHSVKAAEAPETPRGPDTPPLRPRVALRGVIALTGGALLVGLLAGTWIGASSSSARPPAHKLPSVFAGYDAGSVTYFGSIEAIEVWTARTSDGEERCLLTLGDPVSEPGTGTCLPAESEKDLTTAFSGLTTETARRYTIVRQDDGTAALVYDTVDVEALQPPG